jgi:hypothetical protein
VNRHQLVQLLKLSSLLGEKADILVVGSQAILGAIPENRLPAEAMRSIEADITFLDGDEDKSDRVDAMLGEDSKFHRDFGYYAQGVGWRRQASRRAGDLA